jgi:hypothetical protein
MEMCQLCTRLGRPLHLWTTQTVLQGPRRALSSLRIWSPREASHWRNGFGSLKQTMSQPCRHGLRALERLHSLPRLSSLATRLVWPHKSTCHPTHLPYMRSKFRDLPTCTPVWEGSAPASLPQASCIFFSKLWAWELTCMRAWELTCMRAWELTCMRAWELTRCRHSSAAESHPHC